MRRRAFAGHLWDLGLGNLEFGISHYNSKLSDRIDPGTLQCRSHSPTRFTTAARIALTEPVACPERRASVRG